MTVKQSRRRLDPGNKGFATDDTAETPYRRSEGLS